MKNENTLFLLSAIGEISDSVVSEAKPARSAKAPARMRRVAVLAASIALLLAVSAALIFGVGTGREAAPPTSPAVDTAEDTVSMDYAVKAAMDTLTKSGTSPRLIMARLVTEKDQMYYVVKLGTEDGTYDCTVDARSGKVTEVSYDILGGSDTSSKSYGDNSLSASGDNGAGYNLPADGDSPDSDSGQYTSDPDDMSEDDSGSSGDTNRFGEAPKTVYDRRSNDPGYNSSGDSEGLSFRFDFEEPKSMTDGSGGSNPLGLTSPKSQTNPYSTPIRWDMNLP